MKFNKKFTIMTEKFISTCYQPNVCVLSFGAAIFPSLTIRKEDWICTVRNNFAQHLQ